MKQTSSTCGQLNISRENALELVRQLSDVLQNNVNLMDAEGVIIASTNPQRIGQLHGGAKYLLEHDIEMLTIEQDGQFINSQKGINLPITKNGKNVGVIGVTGESKEMVRYAHVIWKMMEILLRENDIAEQARIQEHIRNRYIGRLMSSPHNISSPEFIREGASIGINLAQYRRVLACALLVPLSGEAHPQAGHDDLIEKAMEMLSRQWQSALMARVGQSFIFLMPSMRNSELLAVAEEMQGLVQKRFDLSLVVGIDGTETTAAKLEARACGCDKKLSAASSSLYESYRQASRALDAALRSEGHGIVLYSDMDIGLFVHSVDDAIKKEYADLIFSNIAEEKIQEYSMIIDQYFINDRSIEKIAQKLFMHKNTLQYKIKNMQKETGYDLRTAHGGVVLYFAMLFHSLRTGGNPRLPSKSAPDDFKNCL